MTLNKIKNILRACLTRNDNTKSFLHLTLQTASYIRSTKNN